MKRILFVLWLLPGFSTIASAMPYAFETNSNGWVGAGVGVCLWVPEFKPELFLEAEFAGPPGIGLGFTIIGGSRFVMTINGLFYYDPVARSPFVIPIKVRLGLFGNDFGVGLATGFKFYAMSFSNDINDATDLCFDAEATVNWVKDKFIFSVNAFPGLDVNIRPSTYYYY